MFSAVRPGTDLPSYARDLRRMHDALIAGDPSTLRPRDLVARSWTRVLDAGLDPDGTNARDPLPVEEIERRRRLSQLSGIIDELREVVTVRAEVSRLRRVLGAVVETRPYRLGDAVALTVLGPVG